MQYSLLKTIVLVIILSFFFHHPIIILLLVVYCVVTSSSLLVSFLFFFFFFLTFIIVLLLLCNTIFGTMNSINLFRIIFIGVLFFLFVVNNVHSFDEVDEFDDIPATGVDSPLGEGASSLPVGENNDNFVSDTPNEPKSSKMKTSFRELLYASGDISGNNSFMIEVTFLCFVGFCIWSFVYGKISNRIIAIKWINEHKDLFSDQFSLISAASNAEPNPDELLSQDGYNIYKFYASGRKHCKALLAEISLLKRNDIFWRVIDALAFPAHDKVTMKFALSDDLSAHLALFFLCRKGKQVSIRDENSHFQEFTSQATVANLSTDLVMFSEVNEITEKLFSNDDMNVINEFSDYVELVSVTDLNTEVVEGISETSPPKRILTCTYRLPAPGNMEKIVPLTEVFLRLVDTLFTLRLSVGGKNKVDRNRKVLSDRIAKAIAEQKLQEEQEEIEKKKLEKIEKEKELYDKLPAHLKLKKDQKEEKKKKKDANKSMMKIKKK